MKQSVSSKSSPEAKITKTVILAAVILIILGAGNILFGNYKFSQYSEALVSAEADKQVEKEFSSLPSSSSIHTVDAKLHHIRKLKARLGFYDFVILGGKFFLALAGMTLVALLVYLAPMNSNNQDIADN